MINLRLAESTCSIRIMASLRKVQCACYTAFIESYYSYTHSLDRPNCKLRYLKLIDIGIAVPKKYWYTHNSFTLSSIDNSTGLVCLYLRRVVWKIIEVQIPIILSSKGCRNRFLAKSINRSIFSCPCMQTIALGWWVQRFITKYMVLINENSLQSVRRSWT